MSVSIKLKEKKKLKVKDNENRQDLSKNFTKGDTHIDNKKMEKGSASLVNREQQIKTTITYHKTTTKD